MTMVPAILAALALTACAVPAFEPHVSTRLSSFGQTDCYRGLRTNGTKRTGIVRRSTTPVGVFSMTVIHWAF